MRLTQQQLEAHLWGAANILRGKTAGQDYKNYILSLMNWSNAAIGKINSVLHGLEARIVAGAGTITDPAFRAAGGKVRKFSLVLANFPFSDEFWWLKPKIKRRKADDKHLIRRALLESRLIDAVLSLPLNCFYGAGVPTCLLILKKQLPSARHDQVLLVYAARHFCELSNQNELRPQDVMRILVHAHGYGDPAKVPDLVPRHRLRIGKQIDAHEADEVERLVAEYTDQADTLTRLETQLTKDSAALARLPAGTVRDKAQTALPRLQAQRDRAAAKVAERDEKIAEARRRAEDDRRDVEAVGAELGAIYADPDELLKHARVVGIDEIEENEFNLNIPRYVDTFEPEARVQVRDALTALRDAERAAASADMQLEVLLNATYADRRTRELLSGWARLPMEALIAGEPKNAVSPKTSSQPPGTPTFSIAAIRNGRVDLTNTSNLKYSQISPKVAEKFKIAKGDILIVRGNANPDLVGKAGRITEFPEACIYPDIAMRVVLRTTGEHQLLPESAALMHDLLTGTVRVTDCDINPPP